MIPLLMHKSSPRSNYLTRNRGSVLLCGTIGVPDMVRIGVKLTCVTLDGLPIWGPIKALY